jgi:hypothetical protein
MANKRLVTESDVRAMARGGELVLGSDVIATPAALDLAFQRGMKLSRRDGGGPSATASAASDPLWSRMLAADATYVVVVKGGRANVSRMTDQGPVAFGAGS